MIWGVYIVYIMRALINSRRKIDLAKAFEMSTRNGLTDTEIAKYFDVTVQAVQQGLKRFRALILPEGALETYRANKPGILESVEAKLLSSLVEPARVKKASLNNVAYALGQVAGMTRLEKGLSTSNVAYIDMAQSLEELRQQRLQLEEALDDI